MCEYTLTKFKEKDFGEYRIGISLYKQKDNMSIIAVIYNRNLGTYMLKQFTKEEHIISYIINLQKIT